MNRISELESLILKHKALYYQGRPEISDIEFDRLEDELKKLDPLNMALSIVGSSDTSSDKIKHEKKMLSLGKTYSVSELFAWKGEEEILSTFKLDGISCSLLYKEGEYFLAKTRGDGTYGENITKKVAWIKNIPKKISLKKSIEIRGELYCDEESFFTLSKEMESLGLEKPSNQRNIVAGLMGRKDNLELCRYVKFMAFDIISDDKIEKESMKYELLKKIYFQTPEFIIHNNQESIQDVIESAAEFMNNGHYQIDGLVFTYNKTSLHEELGETSHHPRYKMAYKFQGESKVTKLREITWSVSRNGILTPVGEVEPVELSGAMISRVTLHNYGLVSTHQLKSGDEIEIIRSGEVIPKFLSVKKSALGQFTIPTTCPSCSSALEIVDIRLYCKNSECPGKNLEIILNFIQKIGIEDLSSKRLEDLINADMIKNIPDIYRLTTSDLMKIEKIKDKLSTKLIDSIQKTKEVDLIVFMSALGISGGAFNKCEKIVRAGFDSIDKILNLNEANLISVESFAEKSSKDFITSLDEKKEMIKELMTLGFTFTKEETRQTLVSGKKICITGALSEKRSIIEDKIREGSGIVVSSVSKNTNILVTNEVDPNSSKYKKALEFKLMIITEAELLRMLEMLK